MGDRIASWGFAAAGSFIASALLLFTVGCEAGGGTEAAEAAAQSKLEAESRQQADRDVDQDTAIEPSPVASGLEANVSPRKIGSLSAESIGDVVTVAGEIVQQCPASGCWFQIKDESGQAFIDLIPSGLRLTEKRVGQKAQITGQVVKRGGDWALQAQDVQFETE